MRFCSGSVWTTAGAGGLMMTTVPPRVSITAASRVAKLCKGLWSASTMGERAQPRLRRLCGNAPSSTSDWRGAVLGRERKRRWIAIHRATWSSGWLPGLKQMLTCTVRRFWNADKLTKARLGRAGRPYQQLDDSGSRCSHSQSMPRRIISRLVTLNAILAVRACETWWTVIVCVPACPGS